MEKRKEYPELGTIGGDALASSVDLLLLQLVPINLYVVFSLLWSFLFYAIGVN